MHITFFSVWMTVLWSSILILIFYVLRTKYQLIDMENEQVLAKGNYEKIGMEGSYAVCQV